MCTIIQFETFLFDFLCSNNLHFHFKQIFHMCRPEQGALARAVGHGRQEKEKGKSGKAGLSVVDNTIYA